MRRNRGTVGGERRHPGLARPMNGSRIGFFFGSCSTTASGFLPKLLLGGEQTTTTSKIIIIAYMPCWNVLEAGIWKSTRRREKKNTTRKIHDNGWS